MLTEILNIKTNIISFPNYKNERNSIKIEITDCTLSGEVYDLTIQFMVKSVSIKEAESVSINIISKLNNKTDYLFIDKDKNINLQLILAQAQAPQPFYVGETETGLFLMSVDFRLLITEL